MGKIFAAAIIHYDDFQGGIGRNLLQGEMFKTKFQRFGTVVCIDDGGQAHALMMGGGVECSQHIEPLPSTGSPDHHADEAPEKAKIGSQDKMSTIDKKDGSRSCFCLF